MAQIDIKEAEVRVFDGTLGTVTLDSTPSDSDLVLTAASKHVGSDKVSIELIDPSGASASLAITVLGRKITVDLATSSASAITSTALEVKTAIDNDGDASALTTVALETAGTGVVEAQVEATLDGQKSYTIKIGEGNLTSSEHRNVEFTRDRGILDTVKTADEEPVDLSIDATWEWVTGVPESAILTLEDVLKKVGEASAWVTTADDTCQPYCVDIEIWNAPGCTAIEDELFMFEEYYYETVDHDLREGTISTAGRCNRTSPSARRVLNADIG
jgi:hypothetical protein